MQVKASQTVKVTTGKYTGLVGLVEAVNTDKKTARVVIQGIHEGEPVNLAHWFALGQLEAVQ